MKVLVFEFITGGGLADQPLAPGLAREGRLMADALLRDLAAIPEVRGVALRDQRVPIPAASWVDRIQWVPVSGGKPFGQCYAETMAACDVIWPIAPETDGILENLCAELEAAGRSHLNSPAAAVRLTASKLRTADILRRAGLPVVPTMPRGSTVPGLPWPVVVKPDDGAGCDGSRIIRTEAEWRQLPLLAYWPNAVLQPLLQGEPLSVSALFANGRSRLLSVNRQHIQVGDHGFRLGGCTVNIDTPATSVLNELTAGVAKAFPELWGYAGIDLIMQEQDPVILEINPRLTTSYAGLHQALSMNPAALVLDLWRNGELPEIHNGAAPAELNWFPGDD